MARVAFPYVLQSLSGSAIDGGVATITKHVVGSTPGSGGPATIYTAETGAGTVTGNQLTTDGTGRWTQGSPGFNQYWLDEGTYDIAISGTGLTSYVITREFVSGGHATGNALDFLEGLAANRPAASSVPAGTRWYSTDTQALSFSTGSAWTGVLLSGVPITFTAAVTFATTVNAQQGMTFDAGTGTAGQTVTLTGRNAGTATSGSLAVSAIGAVTLTSGTTTLTGATSGGTSFTSTVNAFNIPAGAQYEINGAQIAAANLADGTTGSGAVVLAASPTFSGTIAGSVTLSGAITFSAAGTAVTINNNATITGTLTVGTVAATTFSGTPNFSGLATGQTATAGDSTGKLATTSFVQNAVTNATGQTPPPLAKALGWVTWNADPVLVNTASSAGQIPTSQTVYVMAIPLVAGQVVTNIMLSMNAAASGAAPTGAFVGLANSAGTMLAQSNNLASNAAWTTAGNVDFAMELPLSAPYTVPTSGLYYAVLLVNGTWGTSGPRIAPVATGNMTIMLGKAGTTTPLFGKAGTTATTLPANGSALPAIANNNQNAQAYWVAAD